MEWISVKDGLPDHKISSLLRASTGHVFSGYYDHDFKEWVSLFIGIFDFKITHWRESLPEPLEGE